MTEEEAIEKLKETQDSYLKDELDLAIETVLKLLEKKDKAIEQLKSINKFQSKDIKEAVDYTFELNAEIEKKDKIIDLMAEHIKITAEYECPSKDCEDNGSITCADCIKEYFTKKVEKENK